MNNLLDQWRAGFGRLDPEVPPCPGISADAWRARHAYLKAFLHGEKGEAASTLGWPTLALFGVDRQRGFAAPKVGLLLRPHRVDRVTATWLYYVGGGSYSAGEVAPDLVLV